MFSYIPEKTLIFCCFTLALLLPVVGHCQETTIKVKSKGRSYVGKKLLYDGSNMMLMRRDGRISFLPVQKASDIKTVSKYFKPYKADVIRSKLLKEFGSKYHVSITGKFVVVHPPGDFQTWATPFEILYQRFRNYFSSRGFIVDEPEFPMIAVVLRKRSEFDKFLRTYYNDSPNTLGYYSPNSNRIITYDPTGGRATKKDWAYKDTLIHEAVHQTAFNTGIHRRHGHTSSWVVEGLACMFEAKGVYNNLHYPDVDDRVNTDRLPYLQMYYKKKSLKGKLKQFVEHDKYFQSNPGLAYAYSWGLTFFLAEKFPSKYFEYLKADAIRSEFSKPNSEQRLKAFTDIFGADFSGMEARLKRFITKLKVK